ncbi:MAG: aldehyde ferredoxin oxidoreductase family protein [Chloroflexi bacterium]|nr:aldehyde ferredoxin oxidoreductase family protein [Chloroflexota bacterium]
MKHPGINRARPIATLACVDLTTRHVEISQAPLELVKKFLGGRGLNMYYLYQNLKPGTDALAPDSPLIIGTGLLTGTGAPNSGRHSVTCKSPESGILGDSNIGGFFGSEMRYAGIDRLLITGKADKPVYLYIEEGRIEIREADKYWGANCTEAALRLKNDLGADAEVELIGPAGENQVRFACTRYGLKNAAGRCGTGAVWGSKKLKAIVARGNSGVPIAHPHEFLTKSVELRQNLQSSKMIQVLGRVGTPFLYDVSNYLGAIRTHNSQTTTFYDSLNAEEMHQYVDKMLACASCVVHCRHRNRLGSEGPEYTTEGLIGANLGIANPRQVVELQKILDELGLDISSTGTYLAWAIELYERGLLTKERTGGKELRFGDYETIKQLIFDIAARRGLGNWLAEGSRLTKQFPGSADFLIAIKGLPQSDPHDVRYLKGFALGIATSSRGADHLRSRPTLEILDLPAKVTEQIYGQPVDPNPTSYRSKAVLVTFSETIFAVVDSIGICKFVCHGFNSPRNLNYDHFRELIYLATGLEFTKEELVGVGRRVVDLERIINMREGMTRASDTLPARYFDEKMDGRKTAGHQIDRAQFAQMLDEFYALHGWDEEGRPSRERIAEFEALSQVQ